MSPAPQTTESWTTRKLLAWISDAFTSKGLESPRLQAEMLVSHVLGCDRLRLYMEADRPALPLERQTLRDLVARALKDEPIDYLVGERWFFGMPFHVSPAVLVPRPSSETIVEQVLLHARAEAGFGGKAGEGVRLADLCTGSGCIAVALLKHLVKARGLATDISPDALALASKNAARHGTSDRVEFLQGDLLGAFESHPAGAAACGDLHYLCANPPYIPDHEWDAVPANVKDYEPHLALRGGSDGLALLRPLVEGCPRFLRPGGLLLLETAASTAATLLGLVQNHPHLELGRIEKDAEGLPRVVIARRRAG